MKTFVLNDVMYYFEKGNFYADNLVVRNKISWKEYYNCLQDFNLKNICN